MPDRVEVTEADRATLLTTDGRGKDAKAAALDRLLSQARAEGERKGREEEREACALTVPTSWLDHVFVDMPLEPTDGCPYVELVLKRVANKIRARGGPR